MDMTADFSGLFTPQSDEITFEALLERVQELEEQVAVQRIDRLTGVLATDEFYATVRQILADYPQEKFVMWRFDIDKFQTVNNLFGVEEGNRLLAYCGKYLSDSMPRTKHSAVGRIGGDVFCGLTPFHESNMTTGEDGHQWLTSAVSEGNMERFLKGFRDDFRFSVSIGFYQVENHQEAVEIIYSRTLAAAKACKDNSEIRYAFYDKALNHSVKETQLITAEMHTALENGEFTVYLQPKVRLSDLSLVGAEALVRWIHPKKGRIPPDSFIPIFEENGFITKLDLYVLRRCCAYIQSWMRQGMTLIPLSVNLSQVDLSTPGLPFKIQGVLGEYKVAAKYIHLEITESAYADDVEQVNGVTQAFKDLGFHLEMDDFGKGYSSLNMIADLPIDTLKLDMGFLQGEQEGSGKVISFVTGLARHMNLTTVAEGIETQEQLAFLRSINCDCGQGYLFSKPLPKAEFDAYMRGCEIGTMGSKVKGIDRTVAEYHGWNTADIWEPDSPFSKMFNAFAGGVGIFELELLSGETRLSRFNAELVQELGTTHQLLKEQCDQILSLVHPEDMTKVKEALGRVDDPKEWNKDHGLQQMDLRIQILKPDHDLRGNPVVPEVEFTWVSIKWRLVEFSAETRTYVILLSNTNEFHEKLEEVYERVEQVDDLERQMAIFSQAGLSGTATFRFLPEQEPEIIYANRHFLYLHSMEEDYDNLKFPLQIGDLLPHAEAKAVRDKYLSLLRSGDSTFDWAFIRTDKKGVRRNTFSSGRTREKDGVLYLDLVLSALNDFSAMEVKFQKNAKENEEILSSADSTVIHFHKGLIRYGSDLQLAFGAPYEAQFDPAEGLPHDNLFHPDSLTVFEKAMSELLQQAGTRTVEIWMRHPDYVDYSLRRATLFSKEEEDGTVQQVSCISKEITKERYGTENVAVGEIITHIPDGLLVFSVTSGKLLYANDSYYQIVGLNQEKMERMYKNFPLLLIEEEESPLQALPEIVDEGRSFVREAQLKNHAMRWIEFMGVRRGPYVYGTVRDITSRKELEILLDRETNFNVILNNIADELLFRVDIQEKIIRFNGKSAKNFGLPAKYIPFTREGVQGRGIVATEHADLYMEMVDHIYNGEEKTFEIQMKTLHESISWYRFEYRIIHESGEPAFAVGKAVNIDYQVELLQKLEKDSLTGLYNGQAIKMRTNQILSASYPIHEPAQKEGAQDHALLVITIENYSDLSTKMNYHQRDSLLLRLAELISHKFRDTDLVGRISEDTFGVFMQQVSMPTMPLQKISDLYLDFKRFNTIAKSHEVMDIQISCAYGSRDGVNYQSLFDNAQLIPIDVEIH